MTIINIEEDFKKIDLILKDIGLCRDLTAVSGIKIIIIGAGGEDIRLTVSLTNEIIIDSFEGCITARKLSEILSKLDTELKKLNIL